jgi:hypothetical protein
MPTPRKGESQKAYVSRCISMRQHEHPEENTKQSAAVCYSMYRKHSGAGQSHKEKK